MRKFLMLAVICSLGVAGCTPVMVGAKAVKTTGKVAVKTTKAVF